MEARVNYTVVGIFVIIMIAFITLGIIWLSSGFSTSPMTTYKIYMTESISGLTLDAPVEFNGVEVGTVKKIKLNQDNPQLVEILISIKQDTPVTQGTTATLSTRGLTGIGFLSLQDHGNNRAPLQMRPGEHHLVIPTKPSLFLRADQALTKLMDDIDGMSKSMQTLLNDQNQLAFKNILINMQHFSTMLSNQSQQFSAILTNTARASQQFPAILQTTQQAVTNFNDITNNLYDLSSELKQNPAILIRGKGQPTLGPGEK